MLDIRTNIKWIVCMNRMQIVRSPQDLGHLIACARRRRGLSQRSVAAGLGVTQAWISRVERGCQKSWIGQVFRLATYLGVELSGDFRTRDDGCCEESGDPRRSYPNLDELV